MLNFNSNGFFPYTPATTLLYGLRESLAMLKEEGLDNVFARHRRLAAACRAAVSSWGFEISCLDQNAYSPVLTAVVMPSGYDSDYLRKIALEHFNISFGAGLGKAAGKVFRIGHLGNCNELTLMAALCGAEMALELAGVPFKHGITAAMTSLTEGGKQPHRSA